MSYVITIGKFESIHRGHQTLLHQVVKHANQLGLKSAAMVFSPHPNIFFNKDKNKEYIPIFTQEERDGLLASTGINQILTCKFDKNFANLSPQEFCQILFEEYNAKLLIVGENYFFGKGRTGDVSLLKAEATKYNADVKVIKISHSEKRTNESGERPEISTSNIRKLLLNGDIQEANQELGFSFFIKGIVTKGKQIGRTINFPTLNIYPYNKLLPPDGVYKTETIINGDVYNSISNIGLRPTINDIEKVRSVETHLLSYYGACLYDTPIQVNFLEFIRPEHKFNSLEELKAQIEKDISLL